MADDLASGASQDSTQAASPVIDKPELPSAAVESAAGGPATLSDEGPAEGVVEQANQPANTTGLIEPAEPGAPQASNQPTSETQTPEVSSDAAQGSWAGETPSELSGAVDHKAEPPPEPTPAAVQYDVRPADQAKPAVVGGYYTPPPPKVRR